jgi:predicted permease
VWLWQDLRLAARTLRKAPGFTTIIVSVLGIGIGATSAIFSLVDAALVRPLPFTQPEQLVMLWERPPSSTHNRVSPLNFLDWSEQQHAFAAMAAVAGGGRTLTGTTSAAERIPGQAVTPRFFEVLGVKPLSGQTFDPVEVTRQPNVVVISERLWRTRFGGEPTLVGRTIALDGQPYTVIGVVPADFQILFPADLWTPFVPRRSPEQRRQHYLQVIGRLKPGVTLDQARADMTGIGDEIARLWPDTNKGWNVTVEPLHEAIVGADLRTTSLVLAGVVGFVLLMACANVANLLLARGLGRSREIAVRAALGGTRTRIVGHLLAESLLLALLGGAAGLALAWVTVRAAPTFIPVGTIPQSIVLAFDIRVTLVAAALTLGTAVIFGLAPTWQALNIPLASTMSAGGRGATRGASALRTALVVGQVAVAILLLSGAGLLVRTLMAMNHVDPGFRADQVLTGSIGLPFNRYNDADRMRRFYLSVERELAVTPGVKAAGFGGSLPLDGWDIGQGFEIVGDPPVEKSLTRAAHYQIVSATYFRTLGIDVVRGRAFTDHDRETTMPVCIVNEEFVRRYGKGREPIGMLVNVQSMDLRGGPTPVVREVVGVIRQVAEAAGEKERALEIYVPIAQNPWFSASLAVQTAGDPMAFLPAVKEAIARVDKDQPLSRVRTMEEVAAEATSQPRFRAELVSLFAVLALILATVGLGGVLAFSVGQRTREFAIRGALGARATDVLQLVLAEAIKMTAAGIAIGLAAAAALTRFMETLLFAIKPIDPVTLIVTAGALALAALVAVAAPAWGAMRVDPAVSLRQE